METRQGFSRAFKLHVVNEVSTGKISKEQARLKYGIKGNSAILNWQRQLSQERMDRQMKQNERPLTGEDMSRRIADLEKSLADERFKNRAYQIYVEELEKEVGNPLAKKSVIGQLTRSKKPTDAEE